MLNRDCMSVEEYESKEFVEFHSSREERIEKRRRTLYEPTKYSLFAFPNIKLNIKNNANDDYGTSKKKKRSYLLVINFLLLGIALVIFLFNYSKNEKIPSNYTLDGVEMKIDAIKLEENKIMFYLFLFNTTEDSKTITFKKQAELSLKNKDKVTYHKLIKLPNTVKLSGNFKNDENTFNFKDELSLNNIEFDRISLKLYLNKEITLETSLK